MTIKKREIIWVTDDVNEADELMQKEYLSFDGMNCGKWYFHKKKSFIKHMEELKKKAKK